MQLYKKIDIPQFEIIQQKLLIIAQELMEPGKTDACQADQDQILSRVPELQSYFQNNNLNWEIGRFFLTAPGESIPIHIDGNEQHPKFLAINLPLTGCAGTKMMWWDNVSMSDVKDLSNYGVGPNKGGGVVLLDGQNKTVIDDLELIDPHVVRINLPHNIVNPTTHDRIVLSIRFNPQPVDLWN